MNKRILWTGQGVIATALLALLIYLVMFVWPDHGVQSSHSAVLKRTPWAESAYFTFRDEYGYRYRKVLRKGPVKTKEFLLERMTKDFESKDFVELSELLSTYKDAGCRAPFSTNKDPRYCAPFYNQPSPPYWITEIKNISDGCEWLVKRRSSHPTAKSCARISNLSYLLIGHEFPIGQKGAKAIDGIRFYEPFEGAAQLVSMVQKLKVESRDQYERIYAQPIQQAMKEHVRTDLQSSLR